MCVSVVYSPPWRRVGGVEWHPSPGDRPQLQRHSVHLQKPHRQHQRQRAGHHRRSVSLQDQLRSSNMCVKHVTVHIFCVQVGSGPPTGPWLRRLWTRPSKLTACRPSPVRPWGCNWREAKDGRRRSTSAWCRTTDWRMRWCTCFCLTIKQQHLVS